MSGSDNDNQRQNPPAHEREGFLGKVQWFVENFGKPPETEPTQLIPQPWRMPAFIGMIVIGLILLAVFVRFVVAPAIATQHSALQRPASTAAVIRVPRPEEVKPDA